MAREEADREDLLNTATAYRERIEFDVPGISQPVFVGFRDNGAASFYFGFDPVYHFNKAGELRRAFAAGKLFKAEAGRLVALDRQRRSTEVALVRDELTTSETAAFVEAARASLEQLRANIVAGTASVRGVTPKESETAIAARVQRWLDDHVDWRVAASAGAL